MEAAEALNPWILGLPVGVGLNIIAFLALLWGLRRERVPTFVVAPLGVLYLISAFLQMTMAYQDQAMTFGVTPRHVMFTLVAALLVGLKVVRKRRRGSWLAEPAY